MAERRHKITVVVDAGQIDGWEDYEIESSMVQPVDAFTLRRPFDLGVWKALPRDARVRVLIDGVIVIDGFVDSRRKRSPQGELEIHGRNSVGRLAQESAPTISYEGLRLTDAVRKLADPWFTKITFSDARNRDLRRGHGRKATAAREPIVTSGSSKSGSVHPGQTRWAVIEEIVSNQGLNVWSSADGTELVIGKPNYDQTPQFLIAHRKPGSGGGVSTVKELIYEEDNGDRYSEITVVGNGGDEENYGPNAIDRRAVWVDGPGLYGVGRDFIRQKRLMVAERSFQDNAEADRIARREVFRRDFNRTKISATMHQHGQYLTTLAPTLFAPNTIARVVDEELGLNATFLIHSCTYVGSHDDGETTTLELVPSGTEIVAS